MIDPRKELVEKMAQSVFEGDHQVNWFHAPEGVKLKYRLFSSDALQVVLDAIEDGEIIDSTHLEITGEKYGILKPAFRKDSK